MKVIAILVLLIIPFQIKAKNEKSYKIGLAVWTGYPSSVKGFKQGLAANGLVEGKNVEYIHRKSEGNVDAQKIIAKEFIARKVDLVYSLTTPGTVIIKESIPSTTPIVFSIVTYPADSGLIESFDYSGNNLVGTSNYVEMKSYVNVLKKFLPSAKKVAIFHRKGEPNSKIQAVNLIRLFKSAGLETIDIQPKSVGELKKMALDVKDRVDAFVTTTDTLIQGGGEKALIKISLKHKIAILSSNKLGIEHGATFGPVADFKKIGYMSGVMAARILKDGKRPSELQSKIQTPPAILVNKKSAKRLGIKINIKRIENARFVTN